jgi:hypothetical protein
MTITKWTINTGEQQHLCYPAARFNEKGCLLVWGGGEMPSVLTQCKEQLEFCFHKRYDSFERIESTLSIRTHPLLSGG